MPHPESIFDDLDAIEDDFARDFGEFRPSDVPSVDFDWDAEGKRLARSVASFLGYGERLPEVL